MTLIELMVAVAIVAILATLAAPSMRSFIEALQLRSATNELEASISYARSEAIKRGKTLTLCKSKTAGSTTPACSTSGSDTWATGWLVFVDENADGALATSGTTDTVVRVSALETTSLTATGGTAFANYLSFHPDGTPRSSNGDNTGSFELCVNGNKRTIRVAVTGRSIQESGTC